MLFAVRPSSAPRKASHPICAKKCEYVLKKSTQGQSSIHTMKTIGTQIEP